MRIRQIVGLLVLLSAFPATIRSQEQNVSATATASTSTYANTTEGLKHLLLDMRTAAKEGNEYKLTAFVKSMEIPNCGAWLHRMYDSDKADSWMGLCEVKFRDPREREMMELFGRIAKQNGKITTRKVNDNPQPGKGRSGVGCRPSSYLLIFIGQVGYRPMSLKSLKPIQLAISCLLKAPFVGKIQSNLSNHHRLKSLTQRSFSQS